MLTFSKTPYQDCHLKVKEEDKKHLFEYFWGLSHYNKQNIYLFALMNRKNTEKINFFGKWNYQVDIDGVKIKVCKALFMKIFQLTPGRLRILQWKIINGKSFDDGRGKHENHFEFRQKTWDLLHEFIDKIPKSESHYSLAKTQKQYFDDTTISTIWLYKKFSKILTNNNIKIISYTCFAKYYNQKFKIKFSKPQTDVCDICFEYLNKGPENITPNQRSEFEKHKND